MARPKSFSTDEVLGLAATVFTSGGHEGTSVDDLVQRLNLHRGSLYKAFGSKRGLFLAVLERYVSTALPAAIAAAVDGSGDAFESLVEGTDLDLLLVAAIERGHHDLQVAALVRQALELLEAVAAQSFSACHKAVNSSWVTATLGARLGRRLLPATENAATR